MEESIDKIKSDIIRIGQLLWEKNLVTGFNGNISHRIGENKIAITGRGTCLGLLKQFDIVIVDLEGKIVGEGQASSERMMHCAVYKYFPFIKSMVHTHTPYTNGFFLKNEVFQSDIYEAKLYLGKVKGVVQLTPSVTDVKPVIEAFESNSIIALRNHGVCAIGMNLFDCFVLIQALEEAILTDTVSRCYGSVRKSGKKSEPSSASGKYELFSQDHIAKLVSVVNQDKVFNKFVMDINLALKVDENNKTNQFIFKNGKISFSHSDKADFLISASKSVWRAVFNNGLDPFVGITQKRMRLEGDFAQISKYYLAINRVFELWQKIKVK